MNTIKILMLVLFLFVVSMLTPKVVRALSLADVLTTGGSVVVKIQEGVEYFLTFKTEDKIKVLEKYAEKRLVKAQDYAKNKNGEMVQNQLQNYLQIKEKQNNLLEKTKSEGILEQVEKRTIEQQKTIEEIKNKVDVDGQEGITQVQEEVVNQVAQRVVEVNGKGGQTEFFNKVEHVWAPGTSAGGSGGVVVVGGQIQFAPGTSTGGNATSDIKTVEVKTGGGDSGTTNTVEGGGGVVSNPGGQGETGATNTIDPGGLAPGTTLDGKNELAP